MAHKYGLISVTEKNSRLQKAAMRIMTFSEFKAHSGPLFKQLKILKFSDSIAFNNCLFVHDYFNNDLPLSFSNILKLTYDLYEYSAKTGKLYVWCVFFVMDSEFDLFFFLLTYSSKSSLFFSSTSSFVNFICSGFIAVDVV